VREPTFWAARSSLFAPNCVLPYLRLPWVQRQPLLLLDRFSAAFSSRHN
jgi:hypothetical protein